MVRKDLIWALKVYIKCKEWKVFVGDRIWKNPVQGQIALLSKYCVKARYYIIRAVSKIGHSFSDHFTMVEEKKGSILCRKTGTVGVLFDP